MLFSSTKQIIRVKALPVNWYRLILRISSLIEKISAVIMHNKYAFSIHINSPLIC